MNKGVGILLIVSFFLVFSSVDVFGAYTYSGICSAGLGGACYGECNDASYPECNSVSVYPCGSDGSVIECFCTCAPGSGNTCTTIDGQYQSILESCGNSCCGLAGGSCVGGFCNACTGTCPDGICGTCESASTCPADCDYAGPECGDGNLDREYPYLESCDDYNQFDNDGCTSYCQGEPGILLSSGLTVYNCGGDSNCVKDDTLKARFRVQGDVMYNLYSFLPDFLYINASSSDGLCQIKLNGFMNGIYKNVSYNDTWPDFLFCDIFSNPSCPVYYWPITIAHDITFIYTLPTISTSCSGKYLTKITADIRETLNNPGTSLFGPYSASISPIRLIKSYCGDGVRNYNPSNSYGVQEACDGTNFGGQTCQSFDFPYFPGQHLTCTTNHPATGCTTIDLSGCNQCINSTQCPDDYGACGHPTCIGGTCGNVYDYNIYNDTQHCGTSCNNCTAVYGSVGYCDNGNCRIKQPICSYDEQCQETPDNPCTQDICKNPGDPWLSYCERTNIPGSQSCNISNSNGTCYGYRYCNAYGVLGDCTARNPAAEICRDGVDNDCDGVQNEGCTNCSDYSTQQPNDMWFAGNFQYDPSVGYTHQGYEQCDFGFPSTNSRCYNNCTFTRCGDNIIQTPNGYGFNEQCDDGNRIANDTCNNLCFKTYCDDLSIQAPNWYGVMEQCDNGTLNNRNDYACLGNCSKAKCGDNYVWTGVEQCDNGTSNNNNGACRTTCVLPFCGDGFVWNLQGGTEQCEDGNSLNNDTCNNCLLTYCGDGIQQRPNGNLQLEQCDNGTNNGPDRQCTTSCQLTYCGDAVKQSPNGQGLWEFCDDGPGGICPDTCLSATCGNGKVEAGEECDNGVLNNATGTCSPSCKWTYCRDGFKQTPNGKNLFGGTPGFNEGCDDGNAFGNDTCASNCQPTICGDTIVQNPNGVKFPETCDDGNLFNNDKCYTNCTLTKCGDAIIQSPNGFNVTEQCDNGLLNNNNGACLLNCSSAKCGDGFVQSGVEECDDGNVWDGDGCSSNCKFTDCDILALQISGCDGNVCSQGDQLNLNFTYVGSTCSLATLAQTDYYNIAKNCVIQRVAGDMAGINGPFTGQNGSSFRTFAMNYTVPSIPDQCAGKTLSESTSGLYSDSYTVLRSNDYYAGSPGNVLLDQCPQYGVVTPYSLFGDPAFYDIIINGTQCVRYTCASYDAKNAVIVDSAVKGVNLTNASGTFFHQCGVVDNVCPNNFSYGGVCNAQGICGKYGIIDPDCLANIYMRCGGTLTPDFNNVSSCQVPSPTPHRYCGVANSCVYANEVNGSNPQCFGFGVTVFNKDNDVIGCSNNNTWCPEGFMYNIVSGYCERIYSDCTLNGACNTIHNIENMNLSNLHNDTKRMQRWMQYINDNTCFITDANTSRRKLYCARTAVWPFSQYEWSPVIIKEFYSGYEGPQGKTSPG